MIGQGLSSLPTGDLHVPSFTDLSVAKLLSISKAPLISVEMNGDSYDHCTHSTTGTDLAYSPFVSFDDPMVNNGNPSQHEKLVGPLLSFPSKRALLRTPKVNVRPFLLPTPHNIEFAIPPDLKSPLRLSVPSTSNYCISSSSVVGLPSSIQFSKNVEFPETVLDKSNEDKFHLRELKSGL